MSLAAVSHVNDAMPYQLPEPSGGPWTLENAFQHSIAVAKAEPANDQLAYRFLPHALRPHVATLYTFARYTFDFGADPRHEAVREQALAAWESALVDCYRGRATHPVFVALRDTVERFDLPITPFQDYITGARMNMRVRRYATFRQLLGYCEKAVNPMGRLMLKIAGSTEPDDIRACDDVTTAMLLNAFWSNCARDYDRGHIYIPEEDMNRFGITESDLRQRRMTKQFRALMDFQVARTRAYLKRGRPVFDRLPKGLQMEMQMVWIGANVALDNIERDGFDVFNKDHTLRTQDWMRAAVRLAAWRVKDFTQW